MRVGVMFGGFFDVVHGVVQVALGDVGMMRGEMMIARLMMLSRFAMVARGVLMMLGGLAVMLDSMGVHRKSPLSRTGGNDAKRYAGMMNLA